MISVFAFCCFITVFWLLKLPWVFHLHLPSGLAFQIFSPVVRSFLHVAMISSLCKGHRYCLMSIQCCQIESLEYFSPLHKDILECAKKYIIFNFQVGSKSFLELFTVFYSLSSMTVRVSFVSFKKIAMFDWNFPYHIFIFKSAAGWLQIWFFGWRWGPNRAVRCCRIFLQNFAPWSDGWISITTYDILNVLVSPTNSINFIIYGVCARTVSPFCRDTGMCVGGDQAWFSCHRIDLACM